MGKKGSKHYYFGQIAWRANPAITPNTAEFTLLIAYRRDAFVGSGRDGFPVIGDTVFDPIGSTRLAFGDGTSTVILKYVVTDLSTKDNWILTRALDPVTGKKTILHTYSAPADPKTKGPWKAGIKKAHRLAVEEHVNNPGGVYQLETLVEFETLQGSPVAFVPVIVNAPQNSVFSFPVAAAAPDGNSLTCRLATDMEASGIAGGFINPGPPKVPNPLIIDPTTGMVTWDTTGTEPGQLWSYQVVVEDGKSKACVDALIRIIEKAGQPPVCAAPYVIQSAPIGMIFNIDIVAADPDGRIAGIEAVNLPPWATLRIITELPAVNAIANISGIPGPEDTGLHLFSIVATDDDGNQAVTPIKIKVEDGDFEEHSKGKMGYHHDYYKKSGKIRLV